MNQAYFVTNQERLAPLWGVESLFFLLDLKMAKVEIGALFLSVLRITYSVLRLAYCYLHIPS